MDRASDYEPEFAKIDRRWMGDPEHGLTAHELRVLESVTTLCTSLGLTVMAEGIESDAQLDAARVLGITMLQGFLFGAGVAENEFRDRLMQRATISLDAQSPVPAAP